MINNILLGLSAEEEQKAEEILDSLEIWLTDLESIKEIRLKLQGEKMRHGLFEGCIVHSLPIRENINSIVIQCITIQRIL